MLAIPPQSEGLRAATANNRPPLRPFRPHTAARAPPGGERVWPSTTRLQESEGNRGDIP